jgi:hypothetical protein
MARHTVAANEPAIKALRHPDDEARALCRVDGHGNEGIRLYVEHSGTDDLVLPAASARQHPEGNAAPPLARCGDCRSVQGQDGAAHRSRMARTLAKGRMKIVVSAEMRDASNSARALNAVCEFLSTNKVASQAIYCELIQN